MYNLNQRSMPKISVYILHQ